MSGPGIAVVFFISWFMMLFVALPFGVRTQQEAGERLLGTDPGAPVKPMLLRKMLAVTGMAALITFGVYQVLENKLLTLDDVPEFLQMDKSARDRM